MAEGRPAAAPARVAGPAIAGVVLVAVALGVVALRTVMRTASDQVADQSVAPRQRVGTDPGALAPAFTAPAYRGQPITLQRFRGHPIVLNFWASWCPPCRAEMPALEAAYRTYRARGVVVIGIDGATDTWGASRAFLEARAVTYPVGRDDAGQIAQAYHVAGLPTTFFIAADGRVAGVALTGGFTGEDGQRELAKQIEALLH
ncbi:MAG TPA: TlpA disulfide reductase family protein [bacterium]|nr:TlpA disulfide reductase family protein [bacterium]